MTDSEVTQAVVPSSIKGTYYVFTFLLLVNICGYLEAGSVPAMLINIADAFNMNPGEVLMLINLLINESC